MKISQLTLFPLFACSTAFAAPPPTTSLEATLNAIMATASMPAEERSAACGQLAASIHEIDQQIIGSSESQFVPLRKQAKTLYATYCVSHNERLFFDNDSQMVDEDTPGVTVKPATEVKEAAWDTAPACSTEHFVHRCEFNHNKGKGLFILQQSSTESFPNYLVCAMVAGSSRSPLSSSYAIRSQCVLSSLDWRGYAHLPADLPMRPDVHGVLNWANLSTGLEGVMMPKALATQCSAAFSEAKFCSPMLIVLPTAQNRDLVDVCSLETRANQLNLLIVRISSGSSRWTCERLDLTQVVPEDSILKYSDQRCIANVGGQIYPDCNLPYIPRSQNVMHVKYGGRR